MAKQKTDKWTWDPEKRLVVISKNGEFMLGISETQYVTIKVEVKQKKRRKYASSDVPKETGSEVK